jgi:hypothetical protein
MPITRRITPGGLIVLSDGTKNHYHYDYKRSGTRENKDGEAALNKARRQRTLHELRCYALGRLPRRTLSDWSRRILNALDWIAGLGVQAAFSTLPWPNWED